MHAPLQRDEHAVHRHPLLAEPLADEQIKNTFAPETFEQSPELIEFYKESDSNSKSNVTVSAYEEVIKGEDIEAQKSDSPMDVVEDKDFKFQVPRTIKRRRVVDNESDVVM